MFPSGIWIHQVAGGVGCQEREPLTQWQREKTEQEKNRVLPRRR